MSHKCISKSTKKGGNKKQILKPTKSTERFNQLKIDHQHSLLSLSEDKLNILEECESNLLQDFIERNKRIVCISADSYHKNFKLRAVANFHGLEYIDDKGETNIYTRHKITPGTTLAKYLKSLKQDKKDKSAKTTETKTLSVKPSKSTEQFNTLKMDHQYSLLNISEANLNTLDIYEKCILRNFVEKNKRIICILAGFFYADYKFRATTQYYGLEFTDDKGELNIYARHKITPGTTLVNYLKSLKKKKSDSNKQ